MFYTYDVFSFILQLENVHVIFEQFNTLFNTKNKKNLGHIQFFILQMFFFFFVIYKTLENSYMQILNSCMYSVHVYKLCNYLAY